LEGGDFVGWFAYNTAFAILITWAFNHSRGSVLLAILFHASSNATGGSVPVAFFPALFPVAVMPTAPEIGLVVAAVVVVLATRGRLGYDVLSAQGRKPLLSRHADATMQVEVYEDDC
jgi:hypothetical protein